jgi:hypothetical protein
MIVKNESYNLWKDKFVMNFHLFSTVRFIKKKEKEIELMTTYHLIKKDLKD